MPNALGGKGEKRKRSKEKDKTKKNKKKVKNREDNEPVADIRVKLEPPHCTDPIIRAEPTAEDIKPEIEPESEHESEPEPEPESEFEPAPESEPESAYEEEEEEDAPDVEPETEPASEPESAPESELGDTLFELPPLVANINSHYPPTEVLFFGEGRCNRSEKAITSLADITLAELRHAWNKLRNDEERMTVSGQHGCFIVTGSANRPGGVIQMKIKGKRLVVHVLVYLLWRRKFYMDMPVYHICGNNRCANPTHLVQEPIAVNRARKNCRKSTFTECPHEPKCLIFASI